MLRVILWKLRAVSDDSAVNKLLMGHCSLFGGVMKTDFNNNLRLFLVAMLEGTGNIVASETSRVV
jgi:hypothetical protein